MQAPYHEAMSFTYIRCGGEAP